MPTKLISDNLGLVIGYLKQSGWLTSSTVELSFDPQSDLNPFRSIDDPAKRLFYVRAAKSLIGRGWITFDTSLRTYRGHSEPLLTAYDQWYQEKGWKLE